MGDGEEDANDEDFEAELARELALLDSKDALSDKEEPDQPAFLTASVLNTDDDDEEDAEAAEPESLRAWRHMVSARDAQLARFEEELQESKGVGMSAGGTAGGEEAAARQPDTGAQASGQRDQSGVSAADCVQAPVGKQCARGALDTAEAFDPGGPGGAAAPVSALDVQAAIQALQGLVRGGTVEHDDTAASQDSSGAGSKAPGEDSLSEAVLERQALYEEYRHEEERRAAERERARQEAEERERREAEAARVRAEAEAQALALAQAARSAQLEAEAEAARRRALAAEQAAQREQERMEAEAARLQERRAAMAAEAAERQRQMQVLLRDVEEGVVADAKRKLAAARIMRAWHRYRAGAARASRVALVVAMQAACRARAARRLYRQLCVQRDVMHRLDDAASKGQLAAAQEALEMAESAGLAAHGEVAARVAALKAQAKEAAQKLSAAAADGVALAFRAALDAARRYPHLAGLAEESEHVFRARQAAAEAELQRAVEARPISEVNKTLELASHMGIPHAALTVALADARRRDEAAAAALQAAAAAQPFDAALFRERAERAALLGLQSDVATARLAVERRRAGMAAELQRRAAAAVGGEGYADEVRALAASALALGMEREAAALEQQLLGRQRALVQALRQAAASGDASGYEALLADAEQLGVEGTELSAVQGAMQAMHARVREALGRHAEQGTLAGFREASAVAIRAGCSDGAELAHRRVVHRRAAAAAALAAALQAHWLDTDAGRGQQQDTVRLAAIASALQQALGLDKQQRQLVKQPSLRVGCPLPPAVSKLLASSSGSNAVQAAASALWQPVLQCIDLGLSVNAGLSLSVALLHCKVQQAEVAVKVSQTVVSRDYWGQPDLQVWPSEHQEGDRASSSNRSKTPEFVEPGRDAAAEAGAGHVARSGSWGALWAWPAWTHQALADLYRRFTSDPRRIEPSGSSSDKPGPSGQDRQAAAAPVRGRQAAGPGAGLQPRQAQRPSVAPAGQPLTRAMVTSLAPGLRPEDLVRLDLGLERLSSLAGLGQWCPGLKVLLANSNHLTSLEGLEALPHLSELSVKDNYLAASSSSSPAAGAAAARAGSGAEHPAWCRLPAALRKLRLDSNGLQHLPTLLPALPLLRDLSLADNELRHLDLGPHPPAAGAASRPQGASRSAGDAASVQPGPSPRCLALLAPQLSSLDLSGNRLSSLAGLVGCACLTSLDVSRNVLTSLQGVELCLMLQTLDASANELCHPSLLPWPSTSGTLQDGAMGRPALGRGAGDSPAAVPYQQLRSLKLCRNVLTELHSLPPLPALLTLNLQENQISRLCSLDASPSLQTLDLSFNALQEPSCLQALAQLAALQRVSCNDNPMAERKEAYETALTAAAPWALERDGEVLSLQQQAAHATAACSRSAVLAMAAMGALTSGTVANLPWGPAQRVLQPAAKTSASAAPDSMAARGSGQRTCMRGDSAAALQCARLLYGVACTAHGAAPAAGLPCLPSCSGGWAPKSGGGGAWPGSQQQQRQQQQQQQALPGKPSAQPGVQSHYVPGGWLHGLEGSWAASSAVSNATSHAWDAVAIAGLRLPGGRGVVPLAECGGDAVSVMDVWEHDGVHASAWSTAVLLDRPPLHGFAAMASSLGRLRLGTGGHASAAFGSRDGQLGGGEGRSAAGDRSDATALASPGVRASGLGGGLELSKALQAEVEASSIAQAHAHEDAVWSMRRGHAAEASAAALAASWSAMQQQQQQQGGDGEFVLRASNCAALMQEACTAAECMQAAWKARQARRYADVLRSDQHQRAAAAAATAVQAAWRGHRVRAGPELAARRNEAAAERQAAAAADEHVRAVAAARIQAAARGFNVRRRLRAAQQAARYVDADDDDFDFEAGADDVLSGLKGVEDFLRAEDPAFMAAAAVAITGGTARQPPPSLQPPQRPSMPAWGLSGAAALPAAPPPPVSAFSLLASNRPPALDVPGPSRTVPSHSTPAANTQLAAPTQANHSVQAWVESHPGPQIPPSPTHTTTTSHYDSQALETQQQWEQGSASVSQRGDAQVSPSAMSRADSQSISPQNAAAQLLKQQRYREKLEALMQEWGFKDLATAEVYYRRQRRQMQKQVQGKLEARNRDPGVRLKRLQEAVGDRERLRPEDLQKHAVHGPEVHLSRGALQGPPSRQRQGSEQASSEAAGPAGAVGGGGGGGWQQQQQQGWQRAAVVGGASVPPAGRQVVSADAALPSKSLHGDGAAAAVSDSGGPGNGLDQPASLTLQPGVYRSPQHRQQHMLPPLPAAPQPRGEHSRRSMAFGAGGAAGTDGDDSDRVSMHSALSDGVLMQRKTALAPLQQAGSMGSRGPPSLPQASHAAGPSGRPQAGPGGARQSVVLPAMPKGPSVNRWVLADGGNGVGAGLLQINATQLRTGG